MVRWWGKLATYSLMDSLFRQNPWVRFIILIQLKKKLRDEDTASFSLEGYYDKSYPLSSDKHYIFVQKTSLLQKSKSPFYFSAFFSFVQIFVDWLYLIIVE